MFHARTRLPHLLSPRHYFGPARYARELADVFEPAWHLVGTTADLPRDGDFLTTELLGRQLLVRNVAGKFLALANVCAHRHCLLTDLPRGRTARLRCPYHGWEYDDEGRAAHIPQARLFVPLDARSRPQLTRYRIDLCGHLIFVCISEDGPSLPDYLGELYSFCAERFGGDRLQSPAWEPEFPVNWKVPVENALESYHVPAIHPHTFKEDPGETRSTHRLTAGFTELETQLPFGSHSRIDHALQRLEGAFLRTLGLPVTGRYRHVHSFPNLLFSFTDTLSLVQCVIPTGPVGTRNVVRQFGVTRPRSFAGRTLARLWARLAASITRRILSEDFQFYERVQRGLQASEQPGMLGRSEERIYAFQRWLLERCDGDSLPAVEGASCPAIAAAADGPSAAGRHASAAPVHAVEERHS